MNTKTLMEGYIRCHINDNIRVLVKLTCGMHDGQPGRRGTREKTITAIGI